jgi:hypothetical protein
MNFPVSRPLLGALLLVAAGCSKSKPPEAAGVSAPTTTVQSSAVAPADETLLAVKWVLGERLTYRMDMQQRGTIKIAQMPKPMEQELEMSLTYSLSVVKELAGGGREVELEFLAQEMDLKMGGQAVVSYDSKDSGGAKNPMTAALRKVIGSKLRLEYGADGTLAKLIKLDEWRSAMTGDDPGMKMMLDQTFHEGSIRQMVDLGLGLPGKAVAVGASWPVSLEMPAGPIGTLKLEFQSTLRGYEDREKSRCATIDQKGKLSNGAAGEPGPMGPMSLEQGTMDGTSWLDPVRGRLVESKGNQTMKLRGGPPGGEPGFTSDVQQTGTIKLVDVGSTKK